MKQRSEFIANEDQHRTAVAPPAWTKPVPNRAPKPVVKLRPSLLQFERSPVVRVIKSLGSAL